MWMDVPGKLLVTYAFGDEPGIILSSVCSKTIPEMIFLEIVKISTITYIFNLFT